MQWRSSCHVQSLGYRAGAESRPERLLEIMRNHHGFIHLKILGTNMTSTRTTPSNAIAAPSHLATPSIFFCEEAKRVSHFMAEPPVQYR
jgi:hypothetical protein